MISLFNFEEKKYLIERCKVIVSNWRVFVLDMFFFVEIVKFNVVYFAGCFFFIFKCLILKGKNSLVVLDVVLFFSILVFRFYQVGLRDLSLGNIFFYQMLFFIGYFFVVIIFYIQSVVKGKWRQQQWIQSCWEVVSWCLFFRIYVYLIYQLKNVG